MDIKLTNDKPIFIQIAEIIKSDIISSKLKANEKLPSVRMLALSYGINPNTIQKALQILEEDGLIITDRTNGKFVADNNTNIENHKFKIINDEVELFINKMQSLGLSIQEIKEIINKKGE